jgi:hypothetical protein
MTETALLPAVADYVAIAQEHASSTCTDRIVPRKTVVYETLVDPTVIKVAGERHKRQLFAKFVFLKPKAAPIELVSMEKYYEPCIVISARYFLDYYRMCTYNVSIDTEVTEVILLNQKFYPDKNQDSVGSIKLEGEERLVVEKKGFFMLAGNGQEVNLETLPSAPSEKNTEETITKFGIKEINSEADVDLIRKRLVQRPENLSRIVSEVFEIGERVVIYAPRFKLTYVNAETFQRKSIEFDGVTSKRINDENLHFRMINAITAIKSALKKIFKKPQL